MSAYCWHCNARVQFLDDGWVCTKCGQHGQPDLIGDDWEHARMINAPYMERRDADK